MTDQQRLDDYLHNGIHYQDVERLQQPYRGLWQALCARVTDLSPNVPVYQHDLNRWIVELWREQPEAAKTFAVNTTRYDRPLDE